ncbi:3-hydroxyacyl-CoA dehydrogenase NAD-binding domain-containing protein [Profundibacter sp.]
MKQTVAIIGAGETGAGWAARFRVMGWNVRLFDPDDMARGLVGAVLQQARRGLPGLSDVALPEMGDMAFCQTISEAVDGAVWIQECLPERLELKRKVFQKIQEHCGRAAVIASSSGTFTLAELQGCATRPEQIIATHALAPIYLLPLVELAVNDANPPEVKARANEVLQGIGMAPVDQQGGERVSVALQNALQTEADRLIAEGMASPTDITDTLRYGLGLRWAASGLDASQDAVLVAMLRALKAQDAGAGAVLNRFDAAQAEPVLDIKQPLPTVTRTVPLDWTDYNGHMNEARYLQAFGDATDRFMEIIGCDADYIASGGSYFTVETHIRHLDEVHAGARIRVETQCLLGKGKKMQLFHRMFEGDRLLATGEHMMIHVSLDTRRASVPADHIVARLGEIATAHRVLPMPDGAGQAIRGGG